MIDFDSEGKKNEKDGVNHLSDTKETNKNTTQKEVVDNHEEKDEDDD